ncbi:GTPase HflX [Lachnospiraceae bacterium oral taxon 500]|nr:GTPase HflX [Lachnospiraceae bacterium oral taxon 500]
MQEQKQWQKPEKVVLFAVTEKGEVKKAEDSLIELAELTQTAGGEVVGQMIQPLEAVNKRTYLGKGKVEELKALVEAVGAQAVIADDELAPSQIRNLEEALGVKVLDRALLILDIFAQRAATREGILQVEAAQLADSLTRLIGEGHALSRQGGGIGTRGAGEKKLETDRRHIRLRLGILRKELKELEAQREMNREVRRKQGYPLIAIVGYTNAGKSSLLNKLTEADVLAEDKLFATLDTTTRALALSSKQTVMLTDTVGFIRKLPHHLVEAFRSTLEEAAVADLILHVVDGANPFEEKHRQVVYETLAQIGADQIPVITVFNKKDIWPEEIVLRDERAEMTASVSVRTGDGLEELLAEIEEMIRRLKPYIRTTIPYADGQKVDFIRRYGQVVKEEYTENGTYLEAYLEEAYIRKLGLKEEKYEQSGSDF